MLAKVYSCAVIGLDGAIVEVEVDTSNDLPSFVDVGSDSHYRRPLYGKTGEDGSGERPLRAMLTTGVSAPMSATDTIPRRRNWLRTSNLRAIPHLAACPRAVRGGEGQV